VWTPKRIVLLVLGFALLTAAYWTYARFLGGIDGLPALPEAYARPDDSHPAPPPPPDVPNSTDAKLRQAFGEECPELNYAIKLEVKAKGMVLAAKEFVLIHGGERDGQVRLAPLSVALFGKNTPEGKFPEINTVRSNVAFFTFDHPITNPAEMGRHKIVMAELVGQVEVINNRRTPQRDDDLNVFTQGPVFYKDDEHHIWTSGTVEMKDLQSKPDPMVINGTGMDLYLAVETPPPAPPPGQPAAAGRPAGKRAQAAARKPKADTISGVDHVILRQDVEMHLYVDGDSGFLAGGKDGDATKTDKADKTDKTAKTDKADKAAGGEKKAEPARAEARAEGGDKAAAPAAAGGADADANKAHVVIKTQGPFLFDVPKSYARFDIAQAPGDWENFVTVIRSHDLERYDQLNCEHLELQFHPKDGSNSRGVNEDRSLDLEIESAHATGKQVALSSDSEHLSAEGDDFHYDARTRQSILKRSGPDGVWALKDANEVHARELRIVQQKGAQQVTAIGPGWIGLLDKKTSQRTQHASWKDQLVSSKDGAYDLLILTQDALFEDEQQHQRLQADVLKVWLEPAPEPAKDADKKGTAAGADEGEHHGRRPHHVEAIGHVLARSPDMTVHDSDRLLIWFKDGVPAEGAAPARPTDTNGPAALPAPPAAEAQAKPGETPPAEAPGKAPATAAAGGKEPAKGAPEQGKGNRPIDLSARLVEAHVLRNGERNDLDRLWTEGNVKVKQAPANPGEKGVDIQGETLKMIRHPEGNLLTVTGDLGQLRMDKIYIVGPVVNIDQAINKVWVNGIGAMQMDSDKTFDGRQLKEPVPLTVHWSHNMIFWGQRAEFHGGVQAEQETARLLCQSMDVFLDRPVSLKEGEKGQQPAKVRNLVADQAVRVESTDRDEQGRLLKYQRLECPTLSVDNEDNTIHASGPGVVRILQPETDDDPAGPPGQGQAAAPRKSGKPGEAVMKLTRVIYAGGMYANNKNHTAIFTEDVHAVHLPSENVNLDPDIEHLPEGGMYLHCDKLDVYSRQEDGKASQQMKSDGHCSFRTSDSSGRSDMITYDESKSQVIFYGAPGRPAELFRKKVSGQEWETIRAEKIIYIRRTGEVQTINTNGVQSGGR
jgi:lipopolysaccharide export system protein LptA